MQGQIMGTGKLIITNHARERFHERFHAVYPDFGGDTARKLMALLAAAKPEKIDALKRLARLKRHKDTEYYTTACGWRFVVAIGENEERLLVTSERICRLQNRNKKKEE